MNLDFGHTILLYAVLIVGLLFLFFKPSKLSDQIFSKHHDPMQDR